MSEEMKNEEKNNGSTLTIEELNDILEKTKADLDKAKADLEKQKAATTNASADASKWKSQYRATQSEAEKEKAERDEEFNKMKERLAQLDKEKNIASYKSSYVAMGYEESLAERKASAMANGDINEALEIEREFVTFLGKSYAAKNMQSTARPNSGTSQNDSISKEQFSKMSYSELVELKNSDPELYEKLKK